MRKLPYRIIAISTIFSFGGVFLFHFSPVFEGLKGRVYDIFERQSLRYEQVRDDIILVGVDKKTIEYFGQQGSWNRSYYEGLLKEIESHQPKVVAFDYFFTSKERPEKVDWDVIEKLSGLSTNQVDTLFDAYHKTISGTEFISTIDTDFAGVMKRYGNVVLPSVLRVSSSGTILGVDKKPFEAYEKAATVGYANAFPDSDGIIRSFIPSFGSADSFALSIARKLHPQTTISPIAEKTLINYNTRPYDGYKVVSFYKAYNGIWEDYTGEKIDIAGKIVLIGDYDESLGDTYKTPVSDANVTPGVEIVASEVATLLGENAVRFLDDRSSILLLTLLISFSFFSFFFIRSFVVGTIVLVLFSLAVIPSNLYFFLRGWYMDYVTIFLALFLPYFCTYSFRIWRTSQDKRRIERIFSRHVDGSIVQELLKQDISSVGASEKREITVFFSDIEGFTTISERLSPERLIRMLNNFFHIVNGVILKNGGTINKYIGDAVLAFWGAPLRHENHPLAACTTALLIQKALREQAMVFEEDMDSPLNIRFGITTGEVTVGNIGDAKFSDYTIIGDSVNLASRLEGVNKIYHTNIILAEETALLVGSHFILRKLDKISVKGKNNATTIYELMDFKDSEEALKYEAIVTNHELALTAYFVQDWETARNHFSQNFQLQDYVATVFLERIRLLESTNLPKDWDGVNRLLDK